MSIIILNKYLKDMRGKLAGSEFRKRRNKKIELSQKRVPTRPNTVKQKKHAKVYKRCLERYYKLTEEEKRQYIEKYREFNLDAYRAFMKDCLKVPMVIREIPNCALELHLDEGSGSIAKDTSGNMRDGTIHGAFWVEGKLGKAIKTVYAHDRVEVPAFTKGPEISLELWYKPLVTNPSDFLALISDREGDVDFFAMIYHKDLSMNLKVYVQTTAGTFSIISATALVENEWYHIVQTYDTSQLKLYINAVEDANSPIAVSGTPINTDNKVYVGADPYEYMAGAVIDEVRIYSRALDEAEIKDLYQYYPSCKPEMDGVVKVYDRDFRPYF